MTAGEVGGTERRNTGAEVAPPFARRAANARALRAAEALACRAGLGRPPVGRTGEGRAAV